MGYRKYDRTLAFGIQALQVDCLHRAEQSRIFAENLENEIVEPMGMLLEGQDTLTSSYNSKYKESQNVLKTHIEGLRRAKSRYEQARRNIEETLELCEHYRKEDTEVKNLIALNPKMTAELKERTETEQLYKALVTKTKMVKEKFKETATTIIEALKQQEITRSEFIKNSLQKIFEYEGAMEENHLKDNKNASGCIDEIYPKSDIQKLLDTELIDTKEEDIELNIKPSKWDKLYEMYNGFYYASEPKVIDYETLVEETKKYQLENEDEGYKKCLAEFDKLCIELLKPQYGSGMRMIESFKNLFKEPKGGIAFMTSLSNAIGARGNTLIGERELKLITDVFKHFLDSVIPVVTLVF